MSAAKDPELLFTMLWLIVLLLARTPKYTP